MNRYLRSLSRNVVDSIAFLPALISLLFFLFSVGVIYLELSFLPADVEQISENLQVLLVKGNDNARQVLSTVIGGVISLTVFSFSMVMVLLNQATSNFTPRIIPGLLTDKKNQFVLGFYIGTIIYCIIIILNVRPGEMHQHTPKLGVLLAMGFGITCLFLFIYFIHLISRKLHIDVLLASAARQAVRRIGEMHGENPGQEHRADTSDWYPLCSGEAGYLSEVNVRRLEKICRKHDLQIEVLFPCGTFLLDTDVACRVSRDLNRTERLRDKVLACLVFSHEPYGEKSYLYGINQISEAAVKALSPGINDPGTAAIAMDHLIRIFCCLLSREWETSPAAASPARLIVPQPSLEELLFLFIHPVGYYGRHDAKVQARLLEFYRRLLPLAPSQERELIRQGLTQAVTSIHCNVQSPLQSDWLQRKASAANRI
ncbi:MAG: DUF2254 domain-containing protein [Cytophagales bacterium]|nr:DUF2254 domain-containing protein [Cytophagales bacterium]